MAEENEKAEENDVTKLRPRAADAPFTADELRAIAQEVSASYPPPRLGTELVLLEVNPHRAHAYWNIDVEDYRSAAAACGESSPPLMLRLHDVTGLEFDGSNAHSFFDLQVQGMQGHWYVDLWKDGRTHVAEIGLRRADGRLEILARSNPVSTPPASESPHYHTEAVDTAQPDHGRRLTNLFSDPNYTPENMDVETGAEVSLNPPALQIVPVPDAAAYRAPDASIDPSEPPTASFIPSGEQPGDDVARLTTREFPMPAGADSRPALYPPVIPPVIEADFPTVTGSASAEEAKLSASDTSHSDDRPDWPTAEELARFIIDSPSSADAEIEIKSPAEPATESTQNTHAQGHEDNAGRQEGPFAPGPPASLPLEHYVTLFSAEHGQPQVALEVNVELHIFGRAKPGTQVSFYGQPVQLRPDGSFSLRKPLPQGAVVLPLLAIDPPRP